VLCTYGDKAAAWVSVVGVFNFARARIGVECHVASAGALLIYACAARLGDVIGSTSLISRINVCRIFNSPRHWRHASAPITSTEFSTAYRASIQPVSETVYSCRKYDMKAVAIGSLVPSLSVSRQVWRLSCSEARSLVPGPTHFICDICFISHALDIFTFNICGARNNHVK